MASFTTLLITILITITMTGLVTSLNNNEDDNHNKMVTVNGEKLWRILTYNVVKCSAAQQLINLYDCSPFVTCT